VLPSVSSLKVLRQVAQRSKAPKPFIGFGNPLLSGNAQSAFDANRAVQARLRQSCGASPEARTSEPAQRGRRVAVALSGGAADIEQLKHLAPLPETAIELCLVANSFAPIKGDVYLGKEASEATIKSLSESGRLEQYRMLHFATHGALAGQVRGSIEPGLVLTPPAAATPADDGYLSSSEISGLKLNADWVVLSACNTAGSEASNSEAFSGLARAFFYAGTRALLVSHWPVNSDAAVGITTGRNRCDDVTSRHRPRRGAASLDLGPRSPRQRACASQRLGALCAGRKRQPVAQRLTSVVDCRWWLGAPLPQPMASVTAIGVQPLVNTIGCVGPEASTATVVAIRIDAVDKDDPAEPLAAFDHRLLDPARCGGATFRAAIAARSSGDTQQQRRREPR
jgi:hypothetical protein